MIITMGHNMISHKQCFEQPLIIILHCVGYMLAVDTAESGEKCWHGTLFLSPLSLFSLPFPSIPISFLSFFPFPFLSLGALHQVELLEV